MTSNRFRTLLVVASVFFLGTRYETPVANGAPPDTEFRIDKLEREVMALRRELSEFRRVVLDERVMESIFGRWKEYSHIRSGKPVVEHDEVVWRLEPKKASRSVLSPEPPEWILGSMHLDATKSPVWVDFTYPKGDGRVLPGIVKVERDVPPVTPATPKTARIRVHIALPRGPRCTPNEAGQYDKRPTSFESTEENGVSVYVLVPRDSRP